MKRTYQYGLMAAIAALSLLVGCANDAAVVSSNLSQDADNFKVNRRIVFYNIFSDSYILTIEGLCSQEAESSKFAVTCKTGPSAYKKHILGRQDGVTYFSEQIEPAAVSPYHYKVTFKPSVIVPDIEVR